MAVIDFNLVTASSAPSVTVISWANLTGGDTGQPMKYQSFADKTVQAFGTIGSAITMQGSNDPRVESDPDNAVWATLKDNLGEDLVFSEAVLAVIAQAPVYVRPSVASGATNATVIIVANVS